ncbi:MAG TPA: hypothetical protein VFQ00_08495 [Terriglobales bacterium]|nr:hypothetical protein [Terriglobales bacterium]
MRKISCPSIILLSLAVAAYSQSTATLSSQTAKKKDITGLTSTIEIPAGTKILAKLVSPLNTVSARSGAGVYLETASAVIGDNRVVVPAGSYIQGMVNSEARPGRVRGRAQLQFHFTTLILPDHHVLEIDGQLVSLPGSSQYETRNRENTIEPVDQIDKDAATLVESAASGALVGSLAHGKLRTFSGLGIGAAFGLGKVLFKRGDDIRLTAGTELEIVLDRPLPIPASETNWPVSSQQPTPATKPEAARNPDQFRRTRRNRTLWPFPLL